MIRIPQLNKEGKKIVTVLKDQEQADFVTNVNSLKGIVTEVKSVHGNVEKAKDLTTVAGTDEWKIAVSVESRTASLQRNRTSFTEGKITVGDTDYTIEQVIAMTDKQFARLQVNIAVQREIDEKQVRLREKEVRLKNDKKQSK